MTLSRIRRITLTLIGLGLSLKLIGCTTTALSVDVPYIAQSPFECGVATLQMAFERQGIDYEQERLKNRVFIPALNGTTIGVMAKAAREFGAKATIDTGNNHKLAAWLDEGYSPIILWGPKSGEKIGHFVVVTGITTSHDSFRVHSGLTPDKWVPFSEFMNRWEKGGYRILLVEPGDAETFEISKKGAKPIMR